MKCMVANSRSRIFQHRHEAHAIDWLWPCRCGKTGQLGQSWENVYALRQLAGRGIWLGHARGGDQDRNTISLLVVGMLCPDPEITEMKPVVAPEDHDGVIS